MKLQDLRPTEDQIAKRGNRKIQRVVLRMWYDVVDGRPLLPSAFNKEEMTANDWELETVILKGSKV